MVKKEGANSKLMLHSRDREAPCRKHKTGSRAQTGASPRVSLPALKIRGFRVKRYYALTQKLF